MTSRLLTLWFRLANRDVPRNLDGSLPVVWLIPIATTATGTSGLYAVDHDSRHLPQNQVRYAKIRWRIEHDSRELKYVLGLDHLEGRSYHRFHRHMTMVTAAQLFITNLRLADPKAQEEP